MRSIVRIFPLMLVLVITTGVSLPATPVSPFSLPVSTIIIDPGHGGEDPGAVASRNSNRTESLLEKDITLDIARRVADLITSETLYTVVLTRADDSYLPLAERAAVAAHYDPGIGHKSLYLSIHVNSSPSEDASGFEVLVKKTSKRVLFLDPSVADWVILRYANHTTTDLNHLLNRENLLLATSVHDALRQRFPESRARGVKEQDVWVLNASKVPSALVEVAFISNPDEANLLTLPQWREQMAQSIVEGVLGYINQY